MRVTFVKILKGRDEKGQGGMVKVMYNFDHMYRYTHIDFKCIYAIF